MSLMEQVTDAGYMLVQTKLSYMSLSAKAYLENKLWLGLLFLEQSSAKGKKMEILISLWLPSSEWIMRKFA